MQPPLFFSLRNAPSDSENWKMHLPTSDKDLIQMLFGALHGTVPCNAIGTPRNMTSLSGTVTSHDIHREFEVTSRGSGPFETCY